MPDRAGEMAYCYLYINKQTHKVAYVGKVNQGNSLERRIEQHTHEWWYRRNRFDIYYTVLDSSASADMVETALISEFTPPYNIAKMGWGKTNLLSYNDFEWNKYRTPKEIERETRENILLSVQNKFFNSTNPKLYTIDEVIRFYRKHPDTDVCFCGMDKKEIDTYEISESDGTVYCVKNRGIPEERYSHIMNQGNVVPDLELFIPKRIRFRQGR